MDVVLCQAITQFLVFFVALGVFLQLNGTISNYPVYLFSGLVVVNLFSEAFSNGTRSLVDNAPLIKKIYLPRELFPVSSTFVAFVNFLPQALVVVCLIVGWSPSFVQVLGILLGVSIIVVLAMGLSLLFGSMNVSFRDAQNFVELHRPRGNLGLPRALPVDDGREDRPRLAPRLVPVDSTHGGGRVDARRILVPHHGRGDGRPARPRLVWSIRPCDLLRPPGPGSVRIPQTGASFCPRLVMKPQ